jgi:hypothetical protein
VKGITIIPINQAGFKVKFNKKNTVKFRAINYKSMRIKNLLPIQSEVLRRYDHGMTPTGGPKTEL